MATAATSRATLRTDIGRVTSSAQVLDARRLGALARRSGPALSSPSSRRRMPYHAGVARRQNPRLERLDARFAADEHDPQRRGPRQGRPTASTSAWTFQHLYYSGSLTTDRKHRLHRHQDGHPDEPARGLAPSPASRRRMDVSARMTARRSPRNPG